MKFTMWHIDCAAFADNIIEMWCCTKTGIVVANEKTKTKQLLRFTDDFFFKFISSKSTNIVGLGIPITMMLGLTAFME